ncbi:thermonuclease family protein [Solimonas variicoloris]|uniref:thermonuclease family protein n=1 Tax=Solimonas variicoloris TaxID=254408 RepID=UPI0012B621BA|nr:thermonuclease family protein [Solimonas variicoloris]
MKALPELRAVYAKEPRIAGLFALRPLFWALLLALCAWPAAAWECDAAQVLRVHDGDTVTMRCESGKPVKLRLASVDAPELHQAGGAASRDALAALLAHGTVRVQSRAVDRYERVIAELRVDGEEVGLRLVEQGQAWCGMRPSAACRAAQAAARSAGRGLWAEPSPQAPWQWRRAHPRTD